MATLLLSTEEVPIVIAEVSQLSLESTEDVFPALSSPKSVEAAFINKLEDIADEETKNFSSRKLSANGNPQESDDLVVESLSDSLKEVSESLEKLHVEVLAIEPTTFEVSAVEPTAFEVLATGPTTFEVLATEPTAFEVPAIEPTVFEVSVIESTVHEVPAIESIVIEVPAFDANHEEVAEVVAESVQEEEVRIASETVSEEKPVEVAPQVELQPIEPVVVANPLPAERQPTEHEGIYTMDKRIAMANQLKDKARDEIKAKQFQNAMILYQQALDLTNPQYFRYASEEIRSEFTVLSVNLLNNLAFCYFHIGNYQIASQISDQTLIIDRSNLKAMYRKAVCHKLLGDLERAFETIKHAVKNGGNESKDIYAEYEIIKALYKEYLEKNKQREKEVYSRMVDSTSIIKKAKEEEDQKKQEEAKAIAAAEKQLNQTLLYFFGASAFSFLVASKVLNIDVKSKTGFTLAASLSTVLTITSQVQQKLPKSVLAFMSALILGFMYTKRLTINQK